MRVFSVGAIDNAPASCTAVSCGTDCVVVVGLCGRLRAWKLAAADTSATPSEEAAAVPTAPSSTAANWQQVLDQSSLYELANNRFTSHPYRYLSAVAPDGRFAVATTESTGQVQIWSTTEWRQTQVIDPATSESGKAAREERGATSIRASHSCLTLGHDHLACGSREGDVRLWRAARPKKGATLHGKDAPGSADGEFKRQFGTLHGDDGPLASVVVTEDLVVAVYRASSGLCDGSRFAGGQSACAWSLVSGATVWKHSPKSASPVVTALACDNRLVVLHAHTHATDADWHCILDDTPPQEDYALQAPFLRTAEIGDIKGGGGHDWAVLRRSNVGPGTGRMLAWHVAVTGTAMALGFAGGLLTLFAAHGVRDGSATAPRAPYLMAQAVHPNGADIGAVHVLPVPEAAGRVADHAAVVVAAADASGSVTLWGACADFPGSPLKLTSLRTLPLGGSGGPAVQGTSLGLVGASTMVCGTTTGTVLAFDLCAPDADAAEGKAAEGAPAATEASNGAAPTDAMGAVSLHDPDFGEGPTKAYEWRFNTGAGPQGRGSIKEKRRAFDGWARTLAYELLGLEARPELNGSIGVLLGGVDEASGRAPVKLLAPAEHEGKTLKVKRANMMAEKLAG